MKKGITILLFLLPLVLLGTPFTKNSPFQVKHIGVKDGLSQNMVNAMTMDDDGFLWIGTWDGLNKFDGYSFQSFKPIPFDTNSVSGNFITALHCDKNNQLWVGTEAQGLNLFDPVKETFRRIQSRASYSPFSISHNSINRIAQARDGSIWVATDFGLNQLAMEGLEENEPIPVERYFFHYAKEKSQVNNIQDLLEIAPNKWILACAEGLILFEPKGPGDYSFRRLRFSGSEKPQNLSNFHRVLEYDGKILLGFENGLLIFPKKVFSELEPGQKIPLAYASWMLRNTSVLDMGFDQSGAIWATTADDGLKLKEGGDLDFIDFSLQHSTTGQNLLDFRCIFQDKADRNIWVGTNLDGLKQIHRSIKNFENFTYKPNEPFSLASSSVFSFLEDSHGNIWFGTWEGISVLERSTQKLYSYNKKGEHEGLLGILSSGYIASITEDTYGDIWVGTKKGIFHIKAGRKFVSNLEDAEIKSWNTESHGLTIPHNRVYSVFEDHKRRIWVGTQNGLSILYPKKDSCVVMKANIFDPLGLKAFTIKSFFEDNNRNIWITSNNGLHMAREVGKDRWEFIRIAHEPSNPNSLCSDQVNFIHQDDEGKYWIGTRTGLNKMIFKNRKKYFTYYGRTQGISNEFIYSILEARNGELWMSTNSGVTVFNPDTETFRNFDHTDGIQGNEFNQGAYLKDSDGRFYFGGLSGATRFLPSEILYNPSPPRVFITGIYESGSQLANQAQLKENKAIKLPFDQNDIRFEFVGIDFSNPQKNQYAFKMNGIDKDWQFSFGRRSANYPALKPGSYTFQVRSANGDGVWNPNPATLLVNIVPPFWNRPLFYVILAAMIIAALYAFYRFRVRAQVKYVLDLEDIRQKENEKVRKKAASDFHDELGHYLTRISVLAELLKKRVGEEESDVGNLASRLGDQSRQLYQGTRDFIWAFDPKANNLNEIAIRIKDFGDDLLQDSGINFTSGDINPRLQTINIPSDVCRQVVLLFKEALNNAAKHSQAKEVHLEVYCDYEEKQWSVELSDNGKGLSDPNATAGQGLESMIRRAKKIGLDLIIEGRIPRGLLVGLYSNPEMRTAKQKQA